MLRIDNPQYFFSQVDAQIAELEKYAAEQFQTFCYGVFEYLLYQTPQWTGNAASNWNVSLDAPDETVHHALLEEAQMSGESVGKFPIIPGGPFAKGHELGIGLATQRNAHIFDSITLKNDVYMANSATNLDGKSYMQHLEENPGDFLRPENEPGHMVANAITTFNTVWVAQGPEQLRLPFIGA